MTRIALHARYLPRTSATPPSRTSCASVVSAPCGGMDRGREPIRPGHLWSIPIRSGIQSVLADAQAGRFDLVLSEALDRISRDQDVAGVFRRLSFAGLTIVTLSEGQNMAAVEGQHGIVEGSACVATIQHSGVFGGCPVTASFHLAGARHLRKARVFRNKGVSRMTTTVTIAAVLKNFGAYQDDAVHDRSSSPRTVARIRCCWPMRILSGC